MYCVLGGVNGHSRFNAYCAVMEYGTRAFIFCVYEWENLMKFVIDEEQDQLFSFVS